MGFTEKQAIRDLRKVALTMSHNYNTPVDYWLRMPLDDLEEWLDAANEMEGEGEK